MSEFGLTEQGFVPKTLGDIKMSLETKLKAALGASLDVSVRSVWGQVIGIFAGELAEPWEAAEDGYAALSPDSASGVALVDLAGITGTLPEGALASTVTETLVGTASSPIPEGTVVSVQGRTDARFLTLAAVSLTAVSDWATSTAYAVGDRRKAGSPAHVYQCTQAGASASTGSGPSGTGATVADGTCVWTHLGTGDRAGDVSMSSERLDAVTAPARTLTRIDSPVLGLNSAINLLDADVGRPAETDADLRLRRELELRADGNAATLSILARVSRVNGVESVAVFQNDGDVANGDGMPPHSVEVVVDLDAGPPPDIEDQLRAAIFSSVAGGIRAYGQVTGSVVDASGDTQQVGFSYLTEVPAYIRLDLEVTTDFPADGAAQVLERLLAFEEEKLVGGYDLVAMQVAAVAFEVSGVFNVSNAQVGTSSPASGTRVSVTSRQVVTLDTGRISIGVTTVAP